MSYQYLSDTRGKVTGVFIPIQEWNEIKEMLDFQSDPKNQLKFDLLEAFEQMKLMKAGKLAKPKLKDFINEIQEL
ncbi:hypothetical protein EGI31_10565 [Lacihabitans soyangensis]|uniref:Uncharacterized protein n=2 Tax=Lacihabitans soyangensis TaxID=869394 RepID=A0AAE3KSI7_9BACT|nr:hypothetical protein [Lacihabitans soyangensis]